MVSQALPLSFVHSHSVTHSQSVTHSHSLTFDFDFASLRCALRRRIYGIVDFSIFDFSMSDFSRFCFLVFFGGFRVGRFFRGFDCGWL